MRAFLVTWRSLVSFYNELFLLIGMSLLWWLVGGLFLALAILVGWPMLYIGGPWWLAPIIAIPIGPATAALAHVTHRVARDLRADRSFFFEGFREYWKKALGVSAILMVVTSVLTLNLLFYVSRPEPIVQALSLLFILLLVYWFGVQIYAFPILVGMKEPSVIGAIKMALMMAFANPLFSVLLVIIAALLTGVSIVLAVLVVLAWPAMMLLLGSHSLKLVVERAAPPAEEAAEGDEAK
jgi:uncharacterized membrane protein YesL